jgi:ubiquitin-like 1-activating enzyme E1 B
MEDMWKVPGRTKPVPLDYETIMDGSFSIPPLAKVPAQVAQGSSPSAQPTTTAHAVQGKLKDQQELTIKQNVELFLERSVAVD